jgi:hypothetical protein
MRPAQEPPGIGAVQHGLFAQAVKTSTLDRRVKPGRRRAERGPLASIDGPCVSDHCDRDAWEKSSRRARRVLPCPDIASSKHHRSSSPGMREAANLAHHPAKSSSGGGKNFTIIVWSKTKLNEYPGESSHRDHGTALAQRVSERSAFRTNERP